MPGKRTWALAAKDSVSAVLLDKATRKNVLLSAESSGKKAGL
jgi:hypothetical protein